MESWSKAGGGIQTKIKMNLSDVIYYCSPFDEDRDNFLKHRC